MAANSRIEELTRRLEKEPGSRLFAQLAEELRKEGELADAIRVCREGLTRHPNYPSARMTLGRALLDTGDLAGARAEFEAVLRAAPDNILAGRFLAECHEGLGDLSHAEAQYRLTLQLAPGDKQILSRLQVIEESRRAPITAPLPRPDVAAPRVSPPPLAADPPPIPLVAADEEFEIERPGEALAPTVIMRVPLESQALEPAEPELEPTIVMGASSFEDHRPAAAPTLMMPPPAVAPPPVAPAAVARPAVVPPAFVAPAVVAPAVVAPRVTEAEPAEPIAPPVTAHFARPEAPAEAPHFSDVTQPPVRKATLLGASAPLSPPASRPTQSVQPVAVPVPVLVPADVPKSPAGFTELDDEATVVEPIEILPEPIAPRAPAKPIDDSLDDRRKAGLDTLFRFSALEDGELAPATPSPIMPASAAPIVAEPPRSAAAPPPATVSPSVVTVTSAADPGEIVSPTLAELYFSQGHVDKAVEVYRKILRGGMENERARLRLLELEDMLTRGMIPAPVPVRGTVVEADLSSEERRAAALRKIERLEQLLSVIQKR